jgi:hypothetical protein
LGGHRSGAEVEKEPGQSQGEEVAWVHGNFRWLEEADEVYVAGGVSRNLFWGHDGRSQGKNRRLTIQEEGSVLLPR